MKSNKNINLPGSVSDKGIHEMVLYIYSGGIQPIQVSRLKLQIKEKLIEFNSKF